MFKRIFTLLVCFLLIGTTFFNCFVFADDGGDVPEFFPYQDEMQDSTASIAVYMKNYGYTFGSVVADSGKFYAAAWINLFQKFCAAESEPFQASLNLLKSETGLLTDDIGGYYYSPDAQNLLNKFLNWFNGSNYLTEGTEGNITIGDNGYIVGSDGEKYALFRLNGSTIEWGSFAPLGSQKQLNLASGAHYNISTPWGTNQVTVSKNSYNYNIVVDPLYGRFNGAASIYQEQNLSNQEIHYLGAPVPVVIGNDFTKIYCGVIQKRYKRSGTTVSENGYYLVYSLNPFQTLPTAAPNLNITCDYDGSDIPAADSEATEPQVIHIDTDNYNEYNSNTYNEIVNNPSTITIIRQEPEPDPPYNPYPPTPDNPGGTPSGWDITGGQGSYDPDTNTINFPDFNLPDLNINWSIDGLGNKFPFSIPFDIAALVSVLNAPPEAPRFEGTVDFGFTTWDYDINLEQFDSVAQVCRIAELLLLVFGLILITRSIIKG